MQTIPDQYAGRGSVAGYFFKLVERNECAAIYSQSRVKDLPANGKACAYEVVTLRLRGPRRLGPSVIPAMENLPSEAQWGRDAWTCHTLARAREKLAEVSTPERIAAAVKARAVLAA